MASDDATRRRKRCTRPSLFANSEPIPHPIRSSHSTNTNAAAADRDDTTIRASPTTNSKTDERPVPSTQRKRQKKETNAHGAAARPPLLPLLLPPLAFDAADGDGVPFVIGDPPCAECSTISRFALRGDAERECIRSSRSSRSAGLWRLDDGGERVAIGGRFMGPDVPCPASPLGRGCGGSIVGSCGLLDGYRPPALSGGWRMSGECDVGCWRKGMGLRREPEPGVGVGRPFDGGETRCWLMLPMRVRFASMWSSGPGLSGRLLFEGELREMEGRRARC